MGIDYLTDIREISVSFFLKLGFNIKVRELDLNIPKDTSSCDIL